jgi:hypothetical protein
MDKCKESLIYNNTPVLFSATLTVDLGHGIVIVLTAVIARKSAVTPRNTRDVKLYLIVRLVPARVRRVARK